MMQAGCYGSLLPLRNQGLFRHIVKEQGRSLRALCSAQHAWCTWPILTLLCYFVGISLGMQFSQILPLTVGLPCGEVIAQTHLVFITVPLILLGAQGTKDKFKSAGRQCALLLLICSPGSLITGVRAEPQDEAEVQNCICSAPNAWLISDDVLKAALAGIFLASMTTIGVAVAGRMFKHGPLVPAIPEVVSEVLAIPEVVPEVPAVPTIPAAALALPIFPVVEGEYDIDDVLARAPTPTRLNSPLSWL